MDTPVNKAYVSVYKNNPTVTTLAGLLIDDLECEFLLITWSISANYWYVGAIYDKQIDDCINDNQHIGWYLSEEPNEKNIPIRHAILRNTIEIKNDSSKLLLSFKELITIQPDKLFIILASLEKLALNDLLNRQRFRQELMLSNISHSIRTPLNGILHMTKIIGDSKNTLKDEIKEAAKYLNQSSITLANNIFDIIDMNKLELGKLQLNNESVDIHKLINNVLTFTNTLNKSPNINIDFYIDPSVPQSIYSDAKRIKQILINLIENAIQHTSKGEITMYVHSMLVDLTAETYAPTKKKQFQHFITFTISDTGTGIDAESQKYLFKPPELVSNSKQQGLSLRISYLLAKLLNGNLKLVNSESSGSCFEFSIVADEYARNSPSIPLDNNSETRILVVEDEQINRIVIEKILRQLGFIAITLAASGKEALNIYKKSLFDVVLIDIRMPYMSGFELADYLHAINPQIKMIGVTAQVILENDLKPWFKEFVYKPINSETLKKKISRIIATPNY